jgi:putative membrane protein
MVIWVITRMMNQNNLLKGRDKTPLDLFKERYAKGEIDKQEFEERKKEL